MWKGSSGIGVQETFPKGSATQWGPSPIKREPPRSGNHSDYLLPSFLDLSPEAISWRVVQITTWNNPELFCCLSFWFCVSRVTSLRMFHTEFDWANAITFTTVICRHRHTNKNAYPYSFSLVALMNITHIDNLLVAFTQTLGFQKWSLM